jgi:hypothetical protein
MNCLPHPSAAGYKMTAPARNAGWITVVAAGNPTMEQVIWQNE